MIDAARQYAATQRGPRRSRDQALQPRPQAARADAGRVPRRAGPGEHVELAKRLPGLRGYVIHILDGEAPPYDGIAVTTFDSREDAERAFADPELAAGLARTRDEFAASVEVYFAEEHTIVQEES